MRHLGIHLICALFMLGVTGQAGANEQTTQSRHQHLQGVVVEKGGTLAVKVPNGTTYQLNENRAQRHGHELPKAGDQVTVVVDENNLAIAIGRNGHVTSGSGLGS